MMIKMKRLDDRVKFGLGAWRCSTDVLQSGQRDRERDRDTMEMKMEMEMTMEMQLEVIQLFTFAFAFCIDRYFN